MPLSVCVACKWVLLWYILPLSSLIFRFFQILLKKQWCNCKCNARFPAFEMSKSDCWWGAYPPYSSRELITDQILKSARDKHCIYKTIVEPSVQSWPLWLQHSDSFKFSFSCETAQTFGAWTSCPPGNEWNFTGSGYIIHNRDRTPAFRITWKA